MIFLWICAYSEPQRNTAYRIMVSQSNVSAIFHHLIDSMRHLHTHFVRQPDPTYLALGSSLKRNSASSTAPWAQAIGRTFLPISLPQNRADFGPRRITFLRTSSPWHLLMASSSMCWPALKHPSMTRGPLLRRHCFGPRYFIVTEVSLFVVWPDLTHEPIRA